MVTLSLELLGSSEEIAQILVEGSDLQSTSLSNMAPSRWGMFVACASLPAQCHAKPTGRALLTDLD